MLCYNNRSGSRDLVTYTFRTKFGLAIVRCVRQMDSQLAAAAAAARSTPTTVKRLKRGPAAKLANCKLASSFGNNRL